MDMDRIGKDLDNYFMPTNYVISYDAIVENKLYYYYFLGKIVPGTSGR